MNVLFVWKITSGKSAAVPAVRTRKSISTLAPIKAVGNQPVVLAVTAVDSLNCGILSLLSSTRTLTGPTRRSNIRISIPVPALNALLPLSKASRQTLRPILFSPSSNLLANSPIRNIMQMPKPIFRLRLLLIMLAA